MITKPHLTQIQSTDMEEHPHLMSELLDILSRIDNLDDNSVRGIFSSYEDMVAGASEIGFYKVISDETFKGHPTGYYFDGNDFYIKYGLKSIVDRIEEVEDIAKDTVELVKPKIDEDKIKEIDIEPGDTVIEIPLDGDNYEYVGGIEVDGVDVIDIRIEDDKLIIEVDKTDPSTEINITIPEGAIKTESGKENNEIEIDLIVKGDTPIIEQNPVNNTMVDMVGEQEFRFKVTYPTPPVEGTVDLSLIHCNQGIVNIDFDSFTEEIIIRLELLRGRDYKIIFYGGVVDADGTSSKYMECNFKVKEEKPADPDPGEPDPPDPDVEWEHTFTLVNALSEYDLNIDPIYDKDIPNDLEMYGDKYELYYLGYTGNKDPVKVPRTGVDSFPASNPDGGFVYMSGVFIFETASIGDKVYKLVKVVG